MRIVRAQITDVSQMFREDITFHATIQVTFDISASIFAGFLTLVSLYSTLQLLVKENFFALIFAFFVY